MNQIELAVGERQLLSVRDQDAQAIAVGPFVRGLDVESHDLSDAFAEEPRHSPVATSDIDQTLIASEPVAELVDAAEPVA
jgi:hypothetical protein